MKCNRCGMNDECVIGMANFAFGWWKPKMHALGNFSSPKGLNGFLAWILSLKYALIHAILNVDSRPF